MVTEELPHKSIIFLIGPSSGKFHRIWIFAVEVLYQIMIDKFWAVITRKPFEREGKGASHIDDTIHHNEGFFFQVARVSVQPDSKSVIVRVLA